MPVSTKITINPELLKWARERASLGAQEAARRVGVSADRIAEWEETGELTFKQLEKLAHKTYTPIGYFFLPQPPQEELPIRDFRILGGHSERRPSPELLDTIYLCQRRQGWFREYLIENGATPLSFVGSISIKESVEKVARQIRAAIGWNTEERTSSGSWENTLQQMIDRVEQSGVLVMRNGVVGNNNHRPLSVEEFRGFALCDEYAPLIFINWADTKAARMFTLAHELVHIWLGESGVSNWQSMIAPDIQTETFCNQVAAEMLVPLNELRAAWRHVSDVMAEIKRLARHFRVSTLVLLRRSLDAGFIQQSDFSRLYKSEEDQFQQSERSTSSGGDFYNTQNSRVGKRFARALIESTLEGRTLYNEAFHLLGTRKEETFRKLAKSLQFSV